MSKYLVVYEKAGQNYSAFCPDLPGCVATGLTLDEAEKNIRTAISLHLEGLKEDGIIPPPPSSSAKFIQI